MKEGLLSEGVGSMAGLFVLFILILLAWSGVFLFPGVLKKPSLSDTANPDFWGPINTAVTLGMSLIALFGFFKNSVSAALELLEYYTLGLLCVATIRGAVNLVLKRFAPGSNAGQRIAVSVFCASCLLFFFNISYSGYRDPFVLLAFIFSIPVAAFIVICLEMVRWFWIKMAQARSEKPGE
ncbi:MAG: hypothetical protein LBD67_08485 [Candidatus Accumulibacter sp.]|jgi:hypothetical protein|nr:hypothetical protein [Accumulibacter sp.]